MDNFDPFVENVSSNNANARSSNEGLPFRRLAGSSSWGHARRFGQIVDGIPVDPEFPEGLWSTPNNKRPASHEEFADQPFIRTVSVPWMKEHSGYRYDTYFLDGGAWDRPTCWGKFATLEEAL